MPMQFSDDIRDQVANDLFDRLNTALGTLAKVNLWTGTQPTVCADPDLGTLVAQVPCGSPVFINLTGPSFDAEAMSPTTAVADGVTTYFRFVDEFDEVIFQGSCGVLGGENIVWNDNDFENGDDVQIDSLTMTVQITGA